MYLFGDTQGPLQQQQTGCLLLNYGLIFLFSAAFSINVSDLRSMKNGICCAFNIIFFFHFGFSYNFVLSEK